MSFYATGINKHFLLAKCDNQNIIKYILINKDVFEPSYNDLKITVQNCSYFSTNLTAQKETLQGKCFHNQQEAENAFQEFDESQSTDFYSAEINQLISHWQKYVDCNGSYFD